MKGKIAEKYNKRVFSRQYTKYNKFLKKNIKVNSKIADVCCGSGISIEFLKKKAMTVYGIDASEDMIKLCREKHLEKNVKLSVADASNTGLESGYFDYVIIRMGLHHIKNKQAVLYEANRIMKKSGKLIIIDKFRIYNKLITYFFDFARNILRGNSVFGHYYISIQESKEITKKNFVLLNSEIEKSHGIIKANMVFKKKRTVTT